MPENVPQTTSTSHTHTHNYAVSIKVTTQQHEPFKNKMNCRNKISENKINTLLLNYPQTSKQRFRT